MARNLFMIELFDKGYLSFGEMNRESLRSIIILFDCFYLITITALILIYRRDKKEKPVKMRLPY